MPRRNKKSTNVCLSEVCEGSKEWRRATNNQIVNLKNIAVDIIDPKPIIIYFLSKEASPDIIDAIEIDALKLVPRRHGGILEQTADLDLPDSSESLGEFHSQLPTLDHRYLPDDRSHLVKEGPANALL